MAIEDEHKDILQNIEFAVVNFRRTEPSLTDHSAMPVYEALMSRPNRNVTPS